MFLPHGSFTSTSPARASRNSAIMMEILRVLADGTGVCPPCSTLTPEGEHF